MSAISDVNNNRFKDFKNKGRNVEDMRRRRAEVNVEIRKAKKESHLFKRRHLEGNDERLITEQEQNRPSRTEVSIENIVAGIYSGDVKMEFTATRAARKALSRKGNPFISILINTDGIIPKLVEFLGRENHPYLQDEAVRALGDIAAGTSEQTKAVALADGAVASLIALLTSKHPNVADEAVWTLGNIAGDGPELRDYVTDAGIIEPLLDLVKPDTSAALLGDVTWAISNLCCHRNPRPRVSAVRQLLPTLAHLVQYSTDDEILADACRGLSYLADGPAEMVQLVIDAGLVPRLVALLDHSNDEVVSRALRTVGNLVKRGDAHKDCVLAAGACPLLANLLEHSKTSIVKEAAWSVSNVAAGNASHIRALFSNNVLDPLFHVLDKGDFKCQKEAAWAFVNIILDGNVEQIAALCQMGIIRPMINLLDSSSRDAQTILVVLDGLANILAAAERVGELEKVSLLIEECSGLDRIGKLQSHGNDKIYCKAFYIMERYFSTGESTDDSIGVVPSSTTNDANFEFNQLSQIPEDGFSF